MKRLFFLFFLIILSFCGCEITQREIETKDCFNRSKQTINIVIPNYFSEEIELKAAEFERNIENFKFNFIRVEDDEKYRNCVLDEILNKSACAFYIHGEKDISFFKDLIEPFSLNEKKQRVKIFKDIPAFSLFNNFSGIFTNLNLLKSFGIEEKDLNSFEGFLNSISKIKKESNIKKLRNIVVLGKDLSSLICSLGFKEGEISCEFEKILNFLRDDEKDLNLTFFNNENVFYIGSSRELNKDLLEKNKEHISCFPLPISKNNSVVLEPDYFCFSKNITGPKKEVVLNFFNFIADSKEKDYFKPKFKQKNSEIENMPFCFRKNLKEEIGKLKRKKFEFKTFREDFKKYFLKFKSLDEAF